MKKLILFLTVFVIPVVAGAADMSCANMQSEINALSERDDLSDEENVQLMALKDQYRKACMKRAASRAARASLLIVDNKPEEVSVEYTAEQCDKLKSDIESATDDKEKMQQEFDKNCAKYIVVPELSEEEKQAAADAEKQRIADLRANGLCPDETKPNKFGCCEGERFKDMGNLEFACCTEDTDECLPLVVAPSE